MIDIDFDQWATVLVLPTKPREGHVRTLIQNGRLRDAIRLVMEDLPSRERARALIRTVDRSLFHDEIEAIYVHSTFDQHPQHANGAESQRNDRG